MTSNSTFFYSCIFQILQLKRLRKVKFKRKTNVEVSWAADGAGFLSHSFSTANVGEAQSFSSHSGLVFLPFISGVVLQCSGVVPLWYLLGLLLSSGVCFIFVSVALAAGGDIVPFVSGFRPVFPNKSGNSLLYE